MSSTCVVPLPGSAATPNDAVTRTLRPSGVGIWRSRDRLPQALGQARGAVEPRVREDHRELLAAPARRLVDLARALADRAGGRLEHAVAREMAEAVVDQLEIVEVEHHEPDRRAEALRALDLARELLLELAAVEQLRQRVGLGLLLDQPVQAGVLDRDGALPDERADALGVVAPERPLRARRPA